MTMKNFIMSLATMTLCVPLWAQTGQPVQKDQAAYSANERDCAGRVQRRMVNKGQKMEFTFSGPSNVSFYATSVPPEQFMEFYEKEIIGWLKQNDTGCAYNVYLLGERFVVVVSSTAEPVPWESGKHPIPNIGKYIKKVDVVTLEKHGS